MLRKIILVAVCLALVACATNRSEIKLSAPVAEVSAGNSKAGKSVFIREIVDARVFEQAPKDPSIPSLGFGGADAASAEVKSRAIGRKRNSYGKALGDVLLEPGDTVVSNLRKHLEIGLSDAGFSVSQSAQPAANDMVLDVTINKFWSWFNPGFWAITLNASIATDLKFSNQAQAISIDLTAMDKRQMAPEKAWMEILGMALDDFRAQVKAKSAHLSK